MRKRLGSLLLSLALALSLLPAFAMPAQAEEIGGDINEDLQWTLEDGVLGIYGSGDIPNYSDSDSYRPPWEAYRADIKTVRIGVDVTDIGDYAFWQYPALEEIIFAGVSPALKRIGLYAFDSCSSLTNVKLPDSLTSLASYSFSRCVALEEIRIPDKIKTVGSYAFLNCTSLDYAVIPEGVTRIADGAFDGCSALSCVKLPKSMETIGESAFGNCGALTEVYYGDTEAKWKNVTVDEGNGCLTGANLNCTYTGTSGGLAWELIGNWRGGTLTISGEGEMPDYGSGNRPGWWYVYRDNARFTDLIIEDGVTGIGAYAFDDCYCIDSVELPKSVTSVGKSAFDAAFFDVYYQGSEADRKQITGIGSGNHYLADTADWYYDCGRGTCGEDASWTFRGGVLAIGGRGATDNGAPWKDYQAKVTSVVVGEGIRTIGERAFQSCDVLEYVTLPLTLRTVGVEAFGSTYSRPALKAVYYAGGEADRDKLTIYTRNNERLENAPWHYYSDGPASVGGRLDYEEDQLLYTVRNAPAGSLLIISHYDEDGRLLSLWLRDVGGKLREEGGLQLESLGTEEAGTRFKLMLVDGERFTPLCASWEREIYFDPDA